MLLKMSSRWSLIITPIFFPSSSSSFDRVRNSFDASDVSTIIIMLKYPPTIDCEMSSMFTFASAR